MVSLGRHTDEKLRSVLAALAFLTAAGVTLYTFAARPVAGRPSSGPKPHDILAVSPTQAGDILFALFMLGMFLSISSALVALAPNSHVPGFLTVAAKPSLLNHSAVIRDQNWRTRAGLPIESLERELLDDLHEETRTIALRVEHKLRRFGDSQAWVQFAMTCLVLLADVRLIHLGVTGRVWTIWIVIMVVSFSPIYALVRMLALAFPLLPRRKPDFDRDALRDVPIYRWPKGLRRDKLKQLSYSVWPLDVSQFPDTRWRIRSRVFFVYVAAPTAASGLLLATILSRPHDPIASWVALGYALAWILISRLFTSWAGMSVMMARIWLGVGAGLSIAIFALHWI
jgi:hypothetical protein